MSKVNSGKSAQPAQARKVNSGKSAQPAQARMAKLKQSKFVKSVNGFGQCVGSIAYVAYSAARPSKGCFK